MGEIVVHRNFDCDYKVYRLNGNVLSYVGAETFPILQTKDNVMCFGNFDPSSKNDELVTLRNDDGIVMFSAINVISNENHRNNIDKNADPCQNELPDELFSFLKSASFHNPDLKEKILAKDQK